MTEIKAQCNQEIPIVYNGEIALAECSVLTGTCVYERAVDFVVGVSFRADYRDPAFRSQANLLSEICIVRSEQRRGEARDG